LSLLSRKELASLMGIVKSINSSLDLNETLAIIMDEAKKMMESEASSLLLLDRDRNEFYFNTTTDKKEGILKEIRVPVGTSVAGIVASSGKGLLINNAENDPRIFRFVDQKTDEVTRNILCVPLMVKGHVLGVLEVINKKGSAGFTEEDLDLLSTFSDFAALTINNRDLFRKMKSKAAETSALYRLSESINYCDSMDELLSENIRIVSEVLEAKRVSLIVREDGTFRFKAAAGIPEKVHNKDKVDININVLDYIMKTGRGVFSPDINEDDRFERNNRSRYRDHSFVAAPLKLKNTLFAFLCVTERTRKQPYQQSDLHFLEMLAQQISENYNHSKLSEEYKTKQMMEMELSITARMQQDILPKHFSTDGKLDIAARNIPARLVGGDFYDFIPLGPEKFAIIMADVSGKGLPAGLFMAISHSILRVYLSESRSPAELLMLANKHIFDGSKRGMFVTVFSCMVDTARKKIVYSNAGHFEQYFIKHIDDQIRPVHTSGRPLGIFKEEEYYENTLYYDEGDLLFLYTDGVTEAMNTRLEHYGENRLKANLKKLKNGSCTNILDGVLHDIALFQGKAEQFDDMTLMAVRL
jgi:sigma-B regulation protein RsbU (phosphoserine phosphatase)